MKVIIANKHWHLRGGADKYAIDLAALLDRHGNEAVPFAMRHPNDLPTSWSRYFVSPVQTEKVRFTFDGLRTAGRAVWSFEAARKFGALLDATTPDVVHLQNIYRQISPSIIPQAVRRGIPIVMTANDYALIAPNYSLFHDGAICEVTKPDRYFRAIGHRCVKDSYAASALVAFEMWLHRTLGTWKDIDRIIAPSQFVASLLAEYGIAPEKIVHLPYPVDASAWTPTEGGNYALFVGRLAPEKGIATLIRAAAQTPDVPLHIVGTGPEEAKLKALAEKLDAKNVSFRGFLAGQALKDEYYGARFLVVPSEWYEVYGLVVLEAYAAGKPVIASQIGGLAEAVKDGETGLQVSAGDVNDLAERMHELWGDPDGAIAMGRAGRAWVESDFTPDGHYRKLLEIYASVGSSI